MLCRLQSYLYFYEKKEKKRDTLKSRVTPEAAFIHVGLYLNIDHTDLNNLDLQSQTKFAAFPENSKRKTQLINRVMIETESEIDVSSEQVQEQNELGLSESQSHSEPLELSCLSTPSLQSLHYLNTAGPKVAPIMVSNCKSRSNFSSFFVI